MNNGSICEGRIPASEPLIWDQVRLIGVISRSCQDESNANYGLPVRRSKHTQDLQHSVKHMTTGRIYGHISELCSINEIIRMMDIVGLGRFFKASVTLLLDLLLDVLACIIQCIWRLCDNQISISKTKGALNLDLDPENCQVTSNQFYTYFRARTNNAMRRSCLRLWHTQIFKESKSFQFARRLLNSFL